LRISRLSSSTGTKVQTSRNGSNHRRDHSIVCHGWTSGLNTLSGEPCLAGRVDRPRHHSCARHHPLM
jgi:hypothetical protein